MLYPHERSAELRLHEAARRAFRQTGRRGVQLGERSNEAFIDRHLAGAKVYDVLTIPNATCRLQQFNYNS